MRTAARNGDNINLSSLRYFAKRIDRLALRVGRGTANACRRRRCATRLDSSTRSSSRSAASIDWMVAELVGGVDHGSKRCRAGVSSP
jgi:hypothetical protein